MLDAYLANTIASNYLGPHQVGASASSL